MAKSRPQKPHSRAAKRAASPPIEIAVARPVSPTVPEKIAALGVRGDSGVSKKKKKQKPMSRAQKERKAAAMDKAEAALEKLEKKKESSKGRAKVVQSRRVCLSGTSCKEMRRAGYVDLGY